MILTYKYRLKNAQKAKLEAHARAVNMVWNFCAETQRKTQLIHRQGVRKPWLDAYAFMRLTSGTSDDLGINAKTVNMVCRQFVRSRDRNRKCPRFRASLGPRRALGWIPLHSQGFRAVGNNVVYLEKRFHFFGAARRPLPDKIKDGCFV
jgi:hypothetical protein